MKSSSSFLAIVLSFLTLASSATTMFNVLDYGAIGNGHTDDTNAFLKAWEVTCKSATPSSTMEVPSGKTFLINRLHFKGPCNNQFALNVEINGNIIAPSEEPSQWKCINKDCDNWIRFSDVPNGLSIYGNGVIDGRGQKWWTSNIKLDSRPTALLISNGRNVTLSGLSFRDIPHMHLVLNHLISVSVSNITISSLKDSPNTDGIHVHSSSDVSIDHSRIGTGDDCISISTGTSGLRISNIVCGPGHGISIGSLGKDGSHEFVENVHVSDIVFIGTMYGARIKTWQGGRGYVKDVTYERILAQESRSVIDIDQFYCDHSHCAVHESALQVSNITFRQILGTSRSPAVKLACSESVPCKDIVIDSTYIQPTEDHKALVECQNAYGRVQGMKVPQIPCLDQI